MGIQGILSEVCRCIKHTYTIDRKLVDFFADDLVCLKRERLGYDMQIINVVAQRDFVFYFFRYLENNLSEI